MAEQEHGTAESIEQAIAQLVRYGRMLVARGLVSGPGGNSSAGAGPAARC